MTDAIEGGCRCGRVRYRAALAGLPRVYACHCLDCQTWTGSAFSLQFILPEDQLEVTGEPGLFELTAPDGDRTSRQRACPVCFTRVYNTNTRRPGLSRGAGRNARPQRRADDRGPHLGQAEA